MFFSNNSLKHILNTLSCNSARSTSINKPEVITPGFTCSGSWVHSLTPFKNGLEWGGLYNNMHKKKPNTLMFGLL